MTINLHLVRKTLTCAFVLIVLAAELILFGTGVSAQNYGTGMASAPYSSATANPMSFGTYNTPSSGTYGMPAPAIRPSNPRQGAPNAGLLAVPVVGTAPLTVDFYVGLANTPGWLIYEWDFGDGTELFLPAQPYMIHVYQHPGTYTCELELTTPQGISAIVFTTITVKTSQS